MKHKSSEISGKQTQEKKKVVFPYGNFDRYYGYRSVSYRDNTQGGTIWNDPRLLCLKKQYFKRKTVLDVGCNSGFLTVSVAEKFHPRMILGIDIDGLLITKARKVVSMRANELKQIEKKQSENMIVDDKSDDSFDDPDESTSNQQTNNLLSFKDYHFKEHSIYEDIDMITDYSETFFRTFPNNVYFKQENFLLDLHYGNQYDTITCFSVTKWIHLNWGDDGLIYLLLKCYSLLKKYGILIIEFQTYSSYYKKRNYTDTIQKNYDRLQIQPQQIPLILQHIGMQVITTKIPNTVATLARSLTKGFNRPIVVLKKVGEEIGIDFTTTTVDNLRDVFDVDSLINEVCKKE